MKFTISAKIVSHSHKLSPEAFAIYSKGESNLTISDISERSFVVSTKSPIDYDNIEDFAPAAHKILTLFLITINASTLGFFTFEWLNPRDISYDFSTPSKAGYLSIKPKEIERHDNDITAEEVNRALMLFGGLGAEKDENIYIEYIKGIMHLSFRYGEIEFIREAYGNFYRAFEYLITTRILKVPKLSNELRDLQHGLRKIGASETLIEEFISLYKLRCQQVMHSQKKPVAINIEEVFKIKAYVDLALDRMYKPGFLKHVEEQKSLNK